MRRVIPNLVVTLILLTCASAASAAWQLGVIETGAGLRVPPVLPVMRARLWPLGNKGVPVHIRLLMDTKLSAATAGGGVVVSVEHLEFSDSTATRQTAGGARVYRTGTWGSARMPDLDCAEFIVHFIAFSGGGAPKDSADLVALWNRHEGKGK